MIRRQPRSTRFPSTTLFRSVGATQLDGHAVDARLAGILDAVVVRVHPHEIADGHVLEVTKVDGQRSEDHTHDLQPLAYLVCVLLLDQNDLASHGGPVATQPG